MVDRTSLRQGLHRFASVACVLTMMSGCGKADAGSKDSAAVPGGGSTSAAQLADGKLAGLYIRQQNIPLFMGGRMTFNLVRDFFYFFPDGHMVFGVPNEGELKAFPTADDYAKFQKLEPKYRGTYAIKDGEISLTHEGGDTEKQPFSIPKAGDDSVLQIGPPTTVGSVKAVPFKDGQTIDGVYTFDGTVGLGAANTIYNVKTLTFRPDGTLGSDHLGGVNTEGVDTAVGNSGVTTHSNTTAGGTYRFTGYTLETTVGGKTEKATAFRWSDTEPQPGMICLSGQLFLRQDSK